MRWCEVVNGASIGGVFAAIGGDAVVESGTLWASWPGISVFDPRWNDALGAPDLRGCAVIADTRAPEDSASVVDRDELDADRWRLWGPAGRRRLDEVCANTQAIAARSGVRPLLFPSADGVLSDIPSIATFARAQGVAGIGLVLEPMAMLTEGMLERAEDHLHRLLSLVGEAVGIEAVVLSNVERTGARGLRPCGLMAGILDPGMLARVIGGFRGPLSRSRCIVRGGVALAAPWLDVPGTGSPLTGS